MDNFIEYQIKELKKNNNEWHYKEKDTDIEFVLYCEKYYDHYKSLTRGLYEHLNNLFWKYKEN